MDTYIFYIGELNGTRLGDLRLAASDFGLVAVEWADSQVDFDSYLQKLKRPIQPDAKKIAPYVRELREYLNGKRTAFTIPIDWSLFRPFQREALQVVYRIPYGETCTYHDIAMEIGRPNASRGRRAGKCHQPDASRNPLSPCYWTRR